MHPINSTHARTQPLLFFTELCILRIIPNLNQRIAKIKQTNKRKQKMEMICAIIITHCVVSHFLKFSFSKNAGKQKKKTEPP